MRILQRNLKRTYLIRVATIRRTTDTFLFISHTTNVILFKFRCNIFIGVRIIKEMSGSVASGTPCIICTSEILHTLLVRRLMMFRVLYRNMKLNNWNKPTVVLRINLGVCCVSNEKALSFTAAGSDEVFILPPSWNHGEGDDDNHRTYISTLDQNNGKVLEFST